MLFKKNIKQFVIKRDLVVISTVENINGMSMRSYLLFLKK